MNYRTIFLFTFLIFVANVHAGFVRTSGKQIIDPQGNNMILRGLGTGNWMLQEGYMMQSADVAPTEWQFRNKLIETIGLEKTNQFYKHYCVGITTPHNLQVFLQPSLYSK